MPIWIYAVTLSGIITSSTASLINKRRNLYSKIMRHSILSALLTLVILITSNHLCFAQTNPANSPQTKQVKTEKLEKLKRQVEKIGIGGEITVIRLDKRDFYGRLSNIEADSFQIDEVDLRQPINFNYAEIKTIKKGIGGKSLITGKRSNHKNGLVYAAAIFGTLFVVLIVALSKDR